MNWQYPLADLTFGTEEANAVQQVLASKWLTMGAVTQQFEDDFAQYTGAKHAIAVTNCTVALHLAFLAAGLKPGDEVILPSLTFVAAAAAVLYTGAIPVFADINSEEDLTISPAAIESAITSRTRAILVMHYAGFPCDMEAILQIAERYHLTVIEDAAHAAGSWLNDRHMGTLGLVGCFSFFSNKNLVTGEGGMLTTSDDNIAAKLRRLRSHGMTSLTWDRHKGHAWSYDVVDLGYNYRIDEIRAALGIEQLRKLPEGNSRRARLTQQYHSLLSRHAPQIQLPFQSHRGVSACHILPILLPAGVDRTHFMDCMKSAGIQTSIHYPPIHQFQYYREHISQMPLLPITESVSRREVTLPLYPGLHDHDIEVIVNCICNALSEQGNS